MFQKLAIKILSTILLSVFVFQLKAQVDTQPDSLQTAKDSVVIDTVKVVPKNESDIKSPINYAAKDSMMFSIKTKMIYAYGDAKLSMDKMELEAGYIEMDIDSNEIYATSIENEAGEETGQPVFTQGDEKYQIKTIRYNTKSKKGIVTDVVTEQGGGILHGGKTKMQPNKEIHIIGGKFTTCDADHPHFYIRLTKAKVVPEEKIVSGPFYFVISDIPLPFLGLPFGYFPNQANRSSGIIIPSQGEEKRRGFYLQQGGYYFAINDNMDLTILGDIYSSGSWSINARSNYRKRYRYSGSFNISYQKVVRSEPDLEDYSENKMFWVKFNYARDQKANPTSTFNTSLDFGSSQHRKYTSNIPDPKVFANNNASSSIAYTKTFPGTPFNFSANINATQNLSDKMVNLTLPTLTLNMSKQFPFKRKVSSGSKRWYENISVGFSSNFQNRINIKDSLLFTEHAIKKFENGLQYKIPVSTSIKIFKYFNLAPTFNYQGRVYTNFLRQRPLYSLNQNGEWDIEETYSDTIQGIRHIYDFSFSTPLSTKLYGQVNFKNGAAVRHVMSPSISFSYRPDFGEPIWGYYETDIQNPNALFSTYKNGVYGTPTPGENGSIGFTLGNNFEMKVPSRDTTEEFKKIILLNSLNFGTSYNLVADSLNWDYLTINANTRLFKQINVTANTQIDLYIRDTLTGNRKNITYFEEHGVLGHMNRASIALSGSINSDTFKKGKKGEKDQGKKENEEDGPDLGLDDMGGLKKTNNKQSSKKEEKEGEYNFKVPWNLSINYSFNYTNSLYIIENQKFEPKITQTVNLSGSLTLTPKWKISGNASYDFENKKLVHTSMNITRNLHCWAMSFRFVPFGSYKSYNFRINVVSSMFEGLEYKKRQAYQDNFEF